MKEYNLYNKIKELQDIDKDISEAEKERESMKNLMQSDRLLSTLHSIRKEYLLQISLIAKMESEKINSELCSN